MSEKLRQMADVHLHTRFINYEKTVEMLSDIERLGVSDACLQALPYRGCAENLFALYMKMTQKSPRVRAFGGIHVTDRYAAIPPEKQVRGLWALGCDGIKLMFSPDLEKYYGRGLDDEYFLPMFNYLEENRIPVLIHLADPEEFWQEGKRYDATFPSKDKMYEEAFRMLDKHPSLRVCFAHFMFLSNFPREAERVMEKYKNVYFDLTPGCEMYLNFDKNLDTWSLFFDKYKKRLLHGTDCNIIKNYNVELEKLVYNKLSKKEPFTPGCFNMSQISGLALDDDALQAIFYDNYFDFIGKEARPVNKELFIDACRLIINDLDIEPRDEYYIRGGELIPDLKNDPEQKISYNFCKMALENIKP
jgi:predicted TIM-barrel fold metal-dependent hydrolase